MVTWPLYARPFCGDGSKTIRIHRRTTAASSAIVTRFFIGDASACYHERLDDVLCNNWDQEGLLALVAFCLFT